MFVDLQDLVLAIRFDSAHSSMAFRTFVETADDDIALTVAHEEIVEYHGSDEEIRTTLTGFVEDHGSDDGV